MDSLYDFNYINNDSFYIKKKLQKKLPTSNLSIPISNIIYYLCLILNLVALIN